MPSLPGPVEATECWMRSSVGIQEHSPWGDIFTQSNKTHQTTNEEGKNDQLNWGQEVQKKWWIKPWRMSGCLLRKCLKQFQGETSTSAKIHKCEKDDEQVAWIRTQRRELETDLDQHWKGKNSEKSLENCERQSDKPNCVSERSLEAVRMLWEGRTEEGRAAGPIRRLLQWSKSRPWLKRCPRDVKVAEQNSYMGRAHVPYSHKLLSAEMSGRGSGGPGTGSECHASLSLRPHLHPGISWPL